jgi:hypothetical protein
MARHLEHLHWAVAKTKRLTINHLLINAGDTVSVIGSADYLTSPLGLKLFIAPGMIEVMMGIKNVGKRPTLFCKRCINRRSFRRINARRRTGLGIVNKEAIVIAQTGNLLYFNAHSRSSRRFGHISISDT